MSITIDQLEVMITGNSALLSNEIKKAQNDIMKLQDTTSRATTSMTKSFNMLKKGVMALGIGKLISMAMGSIGGAVERLDTLNNYPRVMANLGVSNDEAQASIKRLSDGLVGLPTTLNDAVSSVQRFTASNGNIKASTEMFLALNNAVIAGNAPMQLQASAIEQISQAYAKGKPDMMEWRTMLQAMPGQLKQVAIAMGYTNADQLGADLRNGTVSMNDFMATIMQLNNEGIAGFDSFATQASNSAGGVATSIANLRTAITRGITDIMNTIGQTNISSFFAMIANAVNSAIPYIAGFVRYVMYAISAVASLFGISAGGVKKVDTSTQSAGASMGNLAKEVGNVNKGIGGANKSAKALKNTLAGFDEMTVLTPPSGGGGGGGGGGGMTPADFGLDPGFFDDFNFGDIFDSKPLDSFKLKADEVFNKIKYWVDLLSPLIAGLFAGFVTYKVATGIQDLIKWFSNLEGGMRNAKGQIQNTQLGFAIMAAGIATTIASVWKLVTHWDELSTKEKVVTGVFAAIGVAAIALGFAIATGISVATLGIGALIGLVVALGTAITALIVKWVNQENTAKNLQQAQERLKSATDSHESAVNRLKSAEQNLLDVQNKLAGANESYIDCVDRAEEATKALEKAQKDTGLSGKDLNDKVKAGTLTYDKMTDAQKQVYRAYLDNDKAQKNLKDSQANLSKEQEKGKINAKQLFDEVSSGKLKYDTLTDAQREVYDAYKELDSAQQELTATTIELSNAVKAETDARYMNDAKLAESGDGYNVYRDKVVEAYQSGQISAEEASDRISACMRGMSDTTRNSFTKDLPDSVKSGIDPSKYQTGWNSFSRFFTNGIGDIKAIFNQDVNGLSDNTKQRLMDMAKWTDEKLTDMKNYFGGLKDKAVGHWNDIKSAVNKTNEDIRSFANEKIENVKTYFSNMKDRAVENWNTVKTNASESFNNIKSNASTQIENVKSYFSGLGTKASEIWTNIKTSGFNKIQEVKDMFNQKINDIKGFFSGLKDKVVEIFGGLAGIIKVPINGIINLVNSAISGLNKIKLPDWIPGVGGKGINIPRIPLLATGGVIDRPTIAVIGEAGREAVMPLDRNTGWIDEIAVRIADSVGGGNDGQPIRITLNLGDEKLIDKVIDGVNDKMFMTNDLVLNL